MCRRRRTWAALLLGLAGVFACQPERSVQPAFYHWQTEFDLTEAEQAYLDSLDAQKVYVKFFDVDWNENQQLPVPLAPIEFRHFPISSFPKPAIIPCIFITNRTFQNLSEDSLAWLSERVHQKLWALKPAEVPFREIQFDCDWTASTRERFFQFLKHFKQDIDDADIALSATIRLHQWRDFRHTGVPPVDRGMLMLYNTGNVESWAEENSILNLESARHYLAAPHRYPLELDLALPIFSWGVLFRDGRMIRLMNNLRAEQLADPSRFLKIADNRFSVQKSTYLNGYYLHEQDQIRTESIDRQLLLQITDQCKKARLRPTTVAFYHLDTVTIKHFPNGFLENILHRLP